MKANILLIGSVVLPVLGGCMNASSEPEDTRAAVPAEVTPPTSTATPTTPASASAPSPMPMGQVVNTELLLPEAVKLSPGATEIAKLARAGVDSGVMLAYVTNSVNTYNLSSDEIVYLNDLGLRPEVVTAMIQHDQQIREASLNGAVAASPATPKPAQSAWANGAILPASNTWQQTVAAPAAESDVQTTVPPPPEEERPTEVTVNYFYDSLAPYGTWVDINGYGRCWRPTVVATTPGWRPYLNNGRWVWSDNGWYWYSDYSWGWAPFHYGRWFSDPYWGWCWMPGTIWGPSWVSWRYTDAYCGWAPLPPAACYRPSIGFTYYGNSCGSSFSFGLTWDCFTFVSYNNFCGRNYNNNRVPRHQSAQVYNNSTVVNNVINGDNNTIINQGIGPERITAATRSEIHRVRVRELAGDQNPRTGRHETLAANGQTLNVVRHTIPGGNPATRSGGPNSSPSGGTVGAAPGTRSALAPTQSATTRGESVRPVDTANRAGGNRTMRSSPSQAAFPSPATPATPASTAANSDAASVSPTAPNTSPVRSHATRTPGALHIRGSQATETASTPPARNVPSPSRSTTATPWLNNTTPAPSSGGPAAAAQPERQDTVRNSGPWNSAAPSRTRADNPFTRGVQGSPAAAAPQAAPVQPTPNTHRSPGSIRAQQMIRQPSPSPQTGRNENNVITIRNWQNSPTRSAPQAAPAPRSFSPPSRSNPQPSYSPVTRNAPSRGDTFTRPTPPSRPSASPARQSAPSSSRDNSDSSSRPSGRRH